MTARLASWAFVVATLAAFTRGQAATCRWSAEAKAGRVVDGDTFDFAEADVWPGLEASGRVRIVGIDAPELGAADPAERQRAAAAKAFLASRIDAGVVELCVEGRDAFGRYLARVYAAGEDVGAVMLDLGLVAPYRR